MRKVNNPPFKGFTLIELLVAASIVAVLGLAIVSTFAAGLRAYGQLKNADIVEADVLLSFQKIEKDLKNTFYFSGIDFTGDKKEISFAGFIHGKSSIGRISYAFDPGAGGALIKTEQPFSGALLNKEFDSLDSKIIFFVKDLVFSYYCLNPETHQYGWSDSFNSANGIPAQVRIKVVFQEGKNNVEREETVSIPVSS